MKDTGSHGVRTTRIAECVAGHYQAAEVPFGVVYRWRSGYVVVECPCGARPALISSETACGRCGADHASVVSGALGNEQLEDENLRPWRYAKDREARGIPR